MKTNVDDIFIFFIKANLFFSPCFPLANVLLFYFINDVWFSPFFLFLLIRMLVLFLCSQHNILRRQQHLKTRQGSVKHLTFYYLSFYNFDNLNWSENFKLFMFAFLGVKSRKSRQYFVYIFKSTCKLQSYSYDFLNAFCKM